MSKYQTSILLTEEGLHSLEQLAQKLNLSKSQTIELAIINYHRVKEILDSEGNTHDKQTNNH